MKLLLLQTELNPGNRKGQLHQGPLALAAFLKEKGHEVHFRAVRNVDRIPNQEHVLSEIEEIDPGLIGFSVMTDEWYYVSRLAASIKERLDIPIICGGPHATMAPEETIADPSIDMLCRGEGEDALAELCECLDNGTDSREIENLWVKDGNRVHRNHLRPLIDDLDVLPFPAYELVDFRRLLDENDGMVDFMVGRGCPFQCSYCINKGLHELYRGKGRIVRRRSPERVIRGLKSMVDHHPGVLSIFFLDDTFSLDKDWFGRFCELYGEEVGLPFGCFMRVEGIDENFLTTFMGAGGQAIELGVESGSEWLRREVLGRRMSLQQMVEAFRLADEFGVETGSLNMVGLPYETKEMVEETMELNKRLRPSSMATTPFQPYPGTRLRELCREEGWFPEGARFLDRGESILDLPTLTKEEIKRYTAVLNEVGIALAVGKHPLGHYDFLAHLGTAEVEQGDGGDVAVSVFAFGGDYVLKASPPTRVTYRLHIPPRSLIDFAVGFHPDAYERTNDGAVFIIDIEHGEHFACRDRVFFKYINPRRSATARGWHEHKLSLSAYAGQEVKISFITRPGPALTGSWRCVGWKRPILTRLSPPVLAQKLPQHQKGYAAESAPSKTAT